MKLYELSFISDIELLLSSLTHSQKVDFGSTEKNKIKTNCSNGTQEYLVSEHTFNLEKGGGAMVFSLHHPFNFNSLVVNVA
jgi:hypothetical protein